MQETDLLSVEPTDELTPLRRDFNYLSSQTGKFNVCVVPSLRPLGVCFLSCGEAHTAALTTVPPSVLFSPTRKSSRFSECRGFFFRMARSSPSARAATDSWDTVPQLRSSDPDWSKALADARHRSAAAGERLEVVSASWRD